MHKKNQEIHRKIRKCILFLMVKKTQAAQVWLWPRLRPKPEKNKKPRISFYGPFKKMLSSSARSQYTGLKIKKLRNASVSNVMAPLKRSRNLRFRFTQRIISSFRFPSVWFLYQSHVFPYIAYNLRVFPVLLRCIVRWFLDNSVRIMIYVLLFRCFVRIILLSIQFRCMAHVISYPLWNLVSLRTVCRLAAEGRVLMFFKNGR